MVLFSPAGVAPDEPAPATGWDYCNRSVKELDNYLDAMQGSVR